jgi:glutathione S-transferase
VALSSQIITVYQGPEGWGTPNVSPFCTKLLCFLNASKLNYEIRPFNPLQAPKGKMPYIKYKGKFFGDSQFIMNFLAKEFSIDLDRNLSDEQKAISHIVRRMLEEATYFHILWNRWGVDDNWHAIKSVYFASMPPLVKHVMPEFLRRSVKRTAFGQGVARHSDEENENIFDRDMQALAVLMSKSGPFFHGEHISEVDCTIFAFLSGILGAKIPRPLGEKWLSHPRFTEYVQYVGRHFFPASENK